MPGAGAKTGETEVGAWEARGGGMRGSGRGKRRHGSWSGWRRSPKRWPAGGTPRRGDPRDDGLAGANVLERRAPGGPAAPGGPGAHRRRSTSARLAPVVRPGTDDRIRRAAARRVLGHRFRRAGRVVEGVGMLTVVFRPLPQTTRGCTQSDPRRWRRSAETNPVHVAAGRSTSTAAGIVTAPLTFPRRQRYHRTDTSWP